VKITKRKMMTAKATVMTLITSIDMTTIIMMMRRSMAIPSSENGDDDGNAKDAYANNVHHDDDNYCHCICSKKNQPIANSTQW